MATDWAAAVSRMRALVQVYLDALAKGPLNVKQAQSLATDLRTLDRDLAGLHAELDKPAVNPAAPTTTFDQAYAKFLDAADAALIAAGKPAGRDGAERGAMTRDECIALAKSIGVLDALGGPDFFGPEPPAGTLA